MVNQLSKMERTKWNKFVKEFANIFFFWLFGIIFFFLFRIFFILFFRNELGENVSVTDYFKVFYMGFKFDTQTTTYFIIIPFLSLLILSKFNKFNVIKKIRKIFQILFVILATLISVITINYYQEYNDQFNQFLFLGLYDDKKAVMTIIKEDFHPILNSIVYLIVVALAFLCFKYFETKQKIYQFLIKIQSKKNNIFLVILSILFVFANLRGSFGSRPVLRKFAYLTSDNFLNKTIINPFKSLKYAIDDFKEINQNTKKNPFGTFNYNSKTISKLLLKKTNGATIKKPKQIFIIVMESYDSWPLLDKYKSFNVANNLKEIRRKSMYFTNFLPAANSTMNSFSSIISNVPFTGINIGRIGAINGAYKTAMFSSFKKLGYETTFFNGGFLSWQNVGNFMTNQGVDKIYSAPDANTKTNTSLYGIEDDVLFDMVLKKTDTIHASLNVILTTSYHPPFTIDVESLGFPYKTKKDLPTDAQKYFSGTMSIKALGHLWFSDKSIGDFIRKAEKKYNNAIFIFTGDHFGRRFLNAKPTLYEKSSVPFIIYGKNIPKKHLKTAGSHIDIYPTILEMIAPKDFEYYSFGNSLLNNKNNKGFGYQKVITKNTLEYFTKNGKIRQFNTENKKETLIKKSVLKRKHDSILSLSWHYLIKGDSLP